MERKKKRFINWLLKEAYNAANVHEALGFARYSFDQFNGMFKKDIDMQLSIDEMRKVRHEILKIYKVF